MEYIINLIGHDLKINNIIKADNCTLTDQNGTKYLDLESGVWCTSIGHSNKAVSEVIYNCSNLFMHSGYCYNSMDVNNSAKKVLEISGLNNGKCVFLCSGSEAVDLAISVSMHITKRKKILVLSDSYLSAFGHFANKDEIETYNWINRNALNEIDYTTIGAFVFEPGSSSGLVRFPEINIISEIIENVRKSGGLLIANEVTTGIGRTGSWFGFNHYGISPDIIAVGKGIGNGYPVSCVLFSEETVSKIDLNNFHYGQSHQNDPMGAKVALCVINEIEKNNLIDRANKIGNYIKSRIECIKEKYGVIKEIRNRGLMFAVEFEPLEFRSISQEVTDILFQEKIILVKRPNNEVIRFDPALTINQSDVDFFLKVFEKAIKEIRLTPASTL